jgi:hypothetical protein
LAIRCRGLAEKKTYIDNFEIFEVLMAVVMEIPLFEDITSCSTLTVS